MKKLNSKKRLRGKFFTYCFYISLSFIAVFLLQSCNKMSETLNKNEFKVRDVKVRLSEYFSIKYDLWGGTWWLEIPIELELPKKVKVDGLAKVYCMKRTYEIICNNSNCKPYTIKGFSIIDDGKFDMKSRWYKICKEAASSGKQMR